MLIGWVVSDARYRERTPWRYPNHSGTDFALICDEPLTREQRRQGTLRLLWFAWRPPHLSPSLSDNAQVVRGAKAIDISKKAVGGQSAPFMHMAMTHHDSRGRP